MATANEALLDLMVRHQIGLQRLTHSVRKDIVRLLDASEADLKAQILRRLDRMGTGKPVRFTQASTKRLTSLEKIIRNIRGAAVKDSFQVVNRTMRQLVKAEAEFVQSAILTTQPVVVNTVLPAADQLLSLVTQQPFEGKVLSSWADDIARADIRRINDQIRIGMVQGETAPQIANRVVGTARLNGADGVTEITRRGAAAIARTAINHYSNQAKAVFYEANADIVKEELYVATLDSGTTPVCRSLDGTRYPLGEGPRPPLHFNCRSLRVAVIDGEVTGTRPSKPTTEKQLLREYTGQNGLKGTATRGGLPRGHKGRFDEFKRQRVRELTGTTPAKTTYQEWLRRQPAAIQDDILGKTRGRLFREGGLTLDKFVDGKGRSITLKNLVKTEKEAFVRSGLTSGLRSQTPDAPKDPLKSVVRGLRKSREVQVVETDLEQISGVKGVVQISPKQKVVELYHVTDRDAAANILRKGFDKDAVNQFQGFESRVKGTYGWSTLDRAKLDIQRNYDAMGFEPGKGDGSFAVVKVQVPRSRWRNMRPDEDFSLDASEWQASYTELLSSVYKGDVPKGWIKSVFVQKGTV